MGVKPLGTQVLDLQFRFSVPFSGGQFDACLSRLESGGTAEYERLSRLTCDEFKQEFPEAK